MTCPRTKRFRRTPNIMIHRTQDHISFLGTRKIALATKDSRSLIDVFRKVDSYFGSIHGEPLKNDRSSTVVKVRVDDEKDIVIRRDNAVSPFKFLKRLFQKSRSRKIWENAQLLNSLGLNTIKPLALIEDYRFLFRVGSYVVYEYIGGTTLKDYYLDPDISFSSKEKMAEKSVASIKSWHSLGITHGDPKSSNILVSRNDLFFIDTEDIKRHKHRWRKRHALARDRYITLHNLQKFPALRKTWVRPFVLDYPYGIHYFGKCLIKKFWKDEYACLAPASGRFGASRPTRHLLDEEWPRLKRRGFLKETGKMIALFPDPPRAHFADGQQKILPEPDTRKQAVCYISPRAFVLERSIGGYFRKRRLPRKGIFSMTLALRICGFALPELIDAGIYRGREYAVFGSRGPDSVLSAWKKAKQDNAEKIKFLTALAEETGRLHAMGFRNLICNINDIFISKEKDEFVIGFKPNHRVRHRRSPWPRYPKKEFETMKNEFLRYIPETDAAFFSKEYRKVVEKSR